MKYLRWLLLPFSWLYGAVVVMRNWCYDAGWFKSTAFSLPVISAGNLAVGGAGKSPMTEYLVRLLKDHKIATLSRGYGRKTKGFILADDTSTAADIGDEPAQFKQKFPEITVAVCEDRVAGANRLKENHEIIILDDAYQHRAIKPGLSILLFDYNKLDEPHFLLPAGNYREPFGGKMRADVIVVSKCPASLTEIQREALREKIRPYPYQHLFFSTINYLPLQALGGEMANISITADTTVFLLTGIAGTEAIENYLAGFGATVIRHKYPDHHQFSTKNITKLANEFSADASANKLIITTEKDAQRLKQPELLLLLTDLPVLVLPISISFIGGNEQFDQLITNYVRQH